MANILIVGATRGLGSSLAKLYAAQPSTTVYGTTRSPSAPTGLSGDAKKLHWIPSIDVSQEDCGTRLVNQLGMLGGGGGMVSGGTVAFDTVFITAGYFATEDFTTGPNWADELKMYRTSAISPPFLIHSLYRAHHITTGSKILLISSEAGSITLRNSAEGSYGHHASKAALNMVGKLLAHDLKDKGVVVSIVHPGFMRTEMTKGVGFDKFWDQGGAVTPDVAAESLREWAEGLDMSRTGEFWAPRGPNDIGSAPEVLGKNLPTPLQLPW